MSSVFEVTSAIIVLLPGFLILRVRQRTTEYRELSTFEFTIISLAYSVAVLLTFGGLNLIMQSATKQTYNFSESVVQMVATNASAGLRLEYAFSPIGASVIWLYIVCGLVVTFITWNFAWLGIRKKLSRVLGLTRFSDHLTPWEDFFILNRLNWVVVELNDGRSLLGKIGMFSHSPFDRQVMLHSPGPEGIQVYDSDRTLIRVGPNLHHSYIHGDEITAIHSIKDDKAQEFVPTAAHYVKWTMSLVLAGIVLVACGFLPVLNYSSVWNHTVWLDVVSLIAACVLIFWNLRVQAKIA